ncbi:GNAT family N-acetyltransferase [Luteolibacter marinus]|uniref:GNAT family N-acetyltransferase n=1 Tax=Luteolibacter marinus TaxID=2776705 RepID=UPI00186691C0|nr:GNAT family N-acetyltransferase [Luteolibacter marinus]
MKPMTLKTNRLILRPPVPADAGAIEGFVSDRRVAEMTALIPHPYPAGGALEWIEACCQAQRDGKKSTWVICLRSTGELVGAISIVDDARDVMLGYWIGVPHWGNGYATEALHRVIRHGFNQLRLRYFSSYHFAHNPASGRVMQKAGLLYQGVQVLSCKRGDQVYDRVCYGITAAEWRANLTAFSRP